MEKGDLVKHWIFGVGFITSITEPTIKNPYQLATIQFTSGQIDECVTTSLTLLSQKKLDK
jgi:hypothetical protein